MPLFKLFLPPKAQRTISVIENTTGMEPAPSRPAASAHSCPTFLDRDQVFQSAAAAFQDSPHVEELGKAYEKALADGLNFSAAIALEVGSVWDLCCVFIEKLG